jgi:hypothetical protein
MKNASYLILGASLLSACNTVKQAEERPNILWIILDDTGLDFSAYGNPLIKTPVFDSLAAQGVLFTNMHVTSPVCSPSRSAMVTGMYQTSNGTHQHRSSRGDVMIFIDEDKPLIPELFQSMKDTIPGMWVMIITLKRITISSGTLPCMMPSSGFMKTTGFRPGPEEPKDNLFSYKYNWKGVKTAG